MTKVIEKNDIRGRRRQAILTAAAEEFWQSGFEHARMDAIAARAVIGKSTIYEYFSSKTALLSAVGEQMAGRAAEEIGRILNSDQPFRSKMVSYMRFLTSLLAQMGQKLLGLFQENQSMALLDKMAQRYAAEEYAALVSAVVRAQEAGELRADLDPAVAATLLASIPAPMFKSYDVPVEEVVDLLLKGMGA